VHFAVADTGPINYLILAGHIELLPKLFKKVAIPDAVREELANQAAPPLVRHWIASPSAWLEVVEMQAMEPAVGLHKGEVAAIALAVSVKADLLLIDERRGVRAAQRQGLSTTGTLGVLDLAAERGLIDFAEAVVRLRATNFRRPDGLLDALLAKHPNSSN
jgi:predicted nucleic acid-binding protein